MKKLTEFVDADIFEISTKEDGTREVHFYGYFYDTGDDIPEPVRLFEPCWVIMPLEELVNAVHSEDEDAYLEMIDDWYSQCKAYEGDLSKDEAEKRFSCFYNGKEPIKITTEEITMDTPDGCYYYY